MKEVVKEKDEKIGMKNKGEKMKCKGWQYTGGY